MSAGTLTPPVRAVLSSIYVGCLRGGVAGGASAAEFNELRLLPDRSFWRTCVSVAVRLPGYGREGGHPHRWGNPDRLGGAAAAAVARRQHADRPASVVPARRTRRPGEEPLESAHRELREEAGIRVEKLRLFWQGLAPSAKFPGAVGGFTIYYATTDADEEDVLCGEGAAMRGVDSTTVATLEFGAAYAQIVPQFLASLQYQTLVSA